MRQVLVGDMNESQVSHLQYYNNRINKPDGIANANKQLTIQSLCFNIKNTIRNHRNRIFFQRLSNCGLLLAPIPINV